MRIHYMGFTNVTSGGGNGGTGGITEIKSLEPAITVSGDTIVKFTLDKADGYKDIVSSTTPAITVEDNVITDFELDKVDGYENIVSSTTPAITVEDNVITDFTLDQVDGYDNLIKQGDDIGSEDLKPSKIYADNISLYNEDGDEKIKMRSAGYINCQGLDARDALSCQDLLTGSLYVAHEITGNPITTIRNDIERNARNIEENASDILALQTATGDGSVGGTRLNDDECQFVTQPLIAQEDVKFEILDGGYDFDTFSPSVVASAISVYENAIYSVNKNNSTSGIIKTDIVSHQSEMVFNNYQFCDIQKGVDNSLYAFSSDTANVKPVKIDSVGNITQTGDNVSIKVFSFAFRDNYAILFGGGSSSTQGVATWRLTDGKYQKINSNGNLCNYENCFYHEVTQKTIATPMYCDNAGDASLAIVNNSNVAKLIKIADLSAELDYGKFCSWGKITQCPWNEFHVLITNTAGGNKHFIFDILFENVISIIDTSANGCGINETVVIDDYILLLNGARVNSSLEQSNKLVKVTEDGFETLDVSIHPKFNIKKAHKMLFNNVVCVGKKSSGSDTGDVHVLRVGKDSIRVEEYDGDKSTEFRSFAVVRANLLYSIPYHDSTSQTDNMLIIKEELEVSGRTGDFLVRKIGEDNIGDGEVGTHQELTSSVPAIRVSNFNIDSLDLMQDSNHTAALTRISDAEDAIEALENQAGLTEIKSEAPEITVQGDTIKSLDLTQNSDFTTLGDRVTANETRYDSDIEDLQDQIDNIDTSGGGTFTSSIDSITIENNVITELDLDQDSKFRNVRDRGTTADKAIDTMYVKKLADSQGNVTVISNQFSFAPSNDFKNTISFSNTNATAITLAPFVNKSTGGFGRDKDATIGTSSIPFDEGHFTKIFLGGTELDLSSLGGATTSTTSAITVTDNVITSLNLDQDSSFQQAELKIEALENKQDYDIKVLSTPLGFQTLYIEPRISQGSSSVVIGSKNQPSSQTFTFTLDSLEQSFHPTAANGIQSLGKADLPFKNAYATNFVGTTLNGYAVSEITALIAKMSAVENDIASIDNDLYAIVKDGGNTLEAPNGNFNTLTAHNYNENNYRLRMQKSATGDYIDMLWLSSDNSIKWRPRNANQFQLGDDTKYLKDGYFKINSALKTKIGTTDNYISMDKIQELLATALP